MIKKIVVLVSLGILLAGCGLVPKATPPLVQHDLGGNFRSQARKPLPLRALSVSATPVVAGLNMHYRDAERSTTRGAYAFNRWAAPPATLVDQALSRLLPMDPAGRCRLNLQLSDFILEIDEADKATALLAGSLRISLDGRNSVYRRIVDVRVPLNKVEPAALAMGQRQAVIQLADIASGWISGEIEQFCLQP